MKTCTRCKVEKELTEFTKRSAAKDGLNMACRDCCRIQSNNSYQRNVQHYVNKSRERTRLRYERFIVWKKSLACLSCGEADYICLDFHHVDPTKKEQDIPDLVRLKSNERVMEELKKCVCLCANCHRKAHGHNVEYQESTNLFNSYQQYCRGVV